MERYKECFKGKKITLMGLGLLGRGVGDATFLAECGAELIVTDLKTETQLADSLAQLKQFSNITFHLGEHKLEDFKDRDMIIKAAGVPLDSVHIKEAKKNKIPVRMSADLFAELSGVPIVGVTGTRGKSTVTQLIAHILRIAEKKVLLGGNVRGVSTLSLLNEVTPDSIGVLELDSWQLQGFAEAKISPQVSVFTTFMPDHMNYYKDDMKAYFADKANIFTNQSESDFLIVGEQAAPFFKQFGYDSKAHAHTTIVGKMPRGWTLKLEGEHNRYNAALAIEAARALGIDDKLIQEAVAGFEAVEGRLQFVREVNGVKIYNDNNATTPGATIAALTALGSGGQNVLLIMGGADKGLDMSGMRSAIHAHCKKVFLLAGTGTDRVRADTPDTKVFDSIPQALDAAVAEAKKGDVILFSPAFASFGMFKNEYDRNDQFIAAVKKLS